MPISTVLDVIVRFFINSADFNGISLPMISEEVHLSSEEFQKSLVEHVSSGDVALAFASRCGNPHTLRISPADVEEQLSLLRTENPAWVCAYPTRRSLEGVLDEDQYAGRPFTLRLAYAEPQLEPVFFDLAVLERYFEDPRLLFRFEDYEGSIVVSDDYLEDEGLAERDKVLLETFGIGYDPDHRRVVAAFLRYLSRLTPDHQQYWMSHLVAGECQMNADYIRASIYGDWPEYYSAYRAFLVEQVEINKLAQILGRSVLFRTTYEHDHPEGFFPMLRPTRRNLHQFVLLLDKLLSENINLAFFQGDVPMEEEITRSDGKIVVRRVGSLNILRNWISSRYRTADGKDVADEIVEPMKRVRKLRQKPAHSISSNEYDVEFASTQDETLGDVIRSLTKIRYVLMSHPRAQGNYTPPDWLDGDKIVFY